MELTTIWCKKNVFLHEDLEEDIYMEISLGFCKSLGGPNAGKLKKALYDLEQSLRTWFRRISKVMFAMKYKRSQGDHTLFIKHLTLKRVITLLVYMDDIIMISNDPEKMRLFDSI